MSDRWGRVAGAAVLSAVALTAAACGSSTSSAPAASTKSSSAAAPTTPGAKAAADFLTKNTDNPATIGLTQPLPGKAPAGKSVIYLKSPQPVAQRSADSLAAAAKALGWTYSDVDQGATPASAVAAFEAALAKKPSAILFAGYPAVVFTKQIQEAKAQGTTVISDATGDGPVDGVIADLGGASQEELYGKLVAAYFVVNSGGKGKAAVFNINAFPILTIFVKSFEDAVKEWCPDCTTEAVNQQVSDAGSKTPSNVVGYLQRNPSVKWAIFGNGDLAQGVSAAVKTAGLKDIKIAGEVPSQANLANLKNGAEAAWSGYPVDILSWRVADTLARHFMGADLAGPLAVPLPGQIITAQNIDKVVLDQGYYIGVDGYQQQFTKLWNAG